MMMFSMREIMKAQRELGFGPNPDKIDIPHYPEAQRLDAKKFRASYVLCKHMLGTGKPEFDKIKKMYDVISDLEKGKFGY